MQTIGAKWRVVPLITGSGWPRLEAAVTMVVHDAEVILVDCGAAEQRPSLVAALARHAIVPESIQTVILTHTHFDHIENLDLFKHARIFVHAHEVEMLHELIEAALDDQVSERLQGQYCRIQPYYSRQIARRLEADTDRYQWILDRLSGDHDKVTQIMGDHEVHEGLRLVPTPGHTSGHVSVHIETAQHGSVWITGDAVPTRRAWGEGGRLPLAVNEDLAHRSRGRIGARPGIIVPGHDQPFDSLTLSYVQLSESAEGAVAYG